MPKPIKKSKTFWVNLLVVVVAGVTGMMGSDIVANNPEVLSYMVAVVGGINIVLRFFTSNSVYAGIKD